MIIRLGCVERQQTLILAPSPALGTLGLGEVLSGMTGRPPGEGDVVRGELARVAGLGDHPSSQD